MRIPHLPAAFGATALLLIACASQGQPIDHSVETDAHVDLPPDGTDCCFDGQPDHPPSADTSNSDLAGPLQALDGGGSGADAAPAARDAPSADVAPMDAEADALWEVTPTFGRSVKQVFSRRCAPCHTTGSAGQRSLLSYADTQRLSSFCGTGTTAECAIERVKRGEMPPVFPPCSGNPTTDAKRMDCVNAEEQDTLARWITAGTPP